MASPVILPDSLLHVAVRSSFIVTLASKNFSPSSATHCPKDARNWGIVPKLGGHLRTIIAAHITVFVLGVLPTFLLIPTVSSTITLPLGRHISMRSAEQPSYLPKMPQPASLPPPCSIPPANSPTGPITNVGCNMWPKQRILFGILSAFALVACTKITPDEMTNSAIGETFARIHIYAQTKRAVPSSLDVLPKRDGYANQTMDGWDRPLQYRIAADGTITLTSLGRDGKPGGSGADADVSVSYQTKRTDGSLWVGSDMWIVEALLR